MNGKVKWFNNDSGGIPLHIKYNISWQEIPCFFYQKIKRWIAPPLLRTLMITYILFIF